MIRAAVLACCLAAGLWAQYPPGTEWRRIRTSHFDIVYHREIEADAQRAANALETLYAPLSQSLGAALPSELPRGWQQQQDSAKNQMVQVTAHTDAVSNPHVTESSNWA